jgi:predicted ATPase/DNA-binding SARP family transcriptional activator
MGLELRVLGGFELRHGSQAVCQWSRVGPRQLLKRLALSEHQAMSVEALAESFWPNETGQRMTARLHHLVYLLRKTLQPNRASEPCLRTDGGIVRLSVGEGFWIDLIEFEQKLDAARSNDEGTGLLEQALTLYRGRLLGNDADEDWFVSRRTQAEGRFVASSHRLAMLQVQHGQLPAAEQTLQRLLKHVPSDEAAHRELITTYGRLGRREDVQRQFNECVSVLQRELDTEPDAETRSAYRAAQALSVEARPSQRDGSEQSSPEKAPANSKRWTAPCPVIQLLGRDEAVRSAVQHLRDGVRLLSLVGTGGIGKTQLAIRIAHEAQRDYAHGACFVPLAESQPGELYTAIAKALGLKLTRHEEPKATVQRALEHSRLLLVADNFEHMVGDVAELALLLQHCAGLLLLVTSRVRLNLAVETCVAVPPLKVESEGAEPPEAVRLFIDCARRIRPKLALDDADTIEVAAITRCLEGLPLAIELAAARLPLFSIGELRLAVEASLLVVAGGGADRPTRQRSLRDSFDWSYRLLSLKEQSLLLMLGLCDASFDHQDARRLAGTNAADAELELQRLVELGFVASTRIQPDGPDAPQGSRFEVAPAIREFVRQELQSHSTREMMQLSFIDHCVKRAEQLDTTIDIDDREFIHQALSQFAVQCPNYFAALNIAHRGDWPAEVCRLVASLARLWGYSGMWHEPNQWIDRASKYVETLDPKHRAKLMYQVCSYWERHGRAEQALVAAKQAVQFSEEADQPSVLVPALRAVSLLSGRNSQVHLEDLSSLLRRARQLAVKLDDGKEKWIIIGSQAMIHYARGDLRRAWAMLAVCARQLKLSGGDIARARIDFNLAKVFAYYGRHKDTLARLDEALLRLQGTSPSSVAQVYLWASWFHCCQMNIRQARRVTQETHETMASLGSEYLQPSLSLLEGRIAFLAGEWPKAIEFLRPSTCSDSTDADPWFRLDAQIWCCQAAMRANADDIATRALSCAVRSRMRWPREHPRILEAAAALFVRRGYNRLAALAWLQASAIRTKKGIVRFPVDQVMWHRTCTALEQNLGSGWSLHWQTQTPAVASDDSLAWLADTLSKTSAHPLPSCDR